MPPSKILLPYSSNMNCSYVRSYFFLQVFKSWGPYPPFFISDVFFPISLGPCSSNWFFFFPASSFSSLLGFYLPDEKHTLVISILWCILSMNFSFSFLVKRLVGCTPSHLLCSSTNCKILSSTLPQWWSLILPNKSQRMLLSPHFTGLMYSIGHSSAPFSWFS